MRKYIVWIALSVGLTALLGAASNPGQGQRNVLPNLATWLAG